MIWVIWLAGGLCAAALAYWMIIIGEGTYFGKPVVRLIYQHGAGIYDRVRQPITASDQAALGGLLRAALLARPLAPVLDVGTGTGRVPFLIAAESWFTAPIAGLDLTPAMLDVAQRKAGAAGLAARISWLVGSGDDLGRWPAATFGLVTCLEAVEYFPRPRRAIREMWRVLQSGGTLLISTWTPRYARWLPGKALTASQLTALLHSLGCDQIETRPWQPGQYDLVIATKA